MEAVANLRNCHMSARKMRLVADLIRGLPVHEALNVLKFSRKEASTWIEQALLSAIANWENKSSGTLSAADYDLVLSEIRVDEGGFIKRFRPAPHGRAHRIRKRSCHVALRVENALPIAAEQAEEQLTNNEE